MNITTCVKENSCSCSSMLTVTELKVAHYLTLALQNRDIAERMFISEKTVKNHLSKIYKKLNVHNRTEAALLMMSRDKSTLRESVAAR